MTASAQSPGPDEDATKSESGATTTPDDAAGDGGAGRLSVDDADRLAAQFRPSWESMDGGWSAPGDAKGEDAPAAEKPEEPAAVAATEKPKPEAPAAPSVVVAPEPKAEPAPTPSAVAAPEPAPEASIIISPEASVASVESAASAAPEPSVVVAPEPADTPSVIVAPDSIAPPAPAPVRPARVTDSSAFDAVMPDPVLPTRGSNRGMLYAAGGVAALIAVAVVAMAFGGSEDDDGDVGAIASAPAEAEGQDDPDEQDEQDEQGVVGESGGGATASADDPSADEAPAEVRVSIRTEPADARLTLDGQLVDNPYEVSIAASGTHTVVATAVGFEGSSESVSFGEDVELTVRLNALAAATAPASMQRVAAMTAARRPAMTGARTMMRRRPAMTAAASSRMRNGRMSMGFTSTNPY